MEGIVTYTRISQATYELNSAISNVESREEKANLIDQHIQKYDNSSASCYLPEIKDLHWLNVNKELNFDIDFNGKIIILDFFTYCCINCLHLLPYLKAVEKKYTYVDGLIVIGVHSGKFDNERSSENVLKAISKLNIEHPVINDEDNYLWNKMAISCWPTVFIIGPEKQILFTFIGESVKDQLELYIDNTLSYFKIQNRINNETASFTIEKNKSDEILNFPGKISFNPTGELLAVSDSGNHRILIISKIGIIEFVVGGPDAGFVDGTFLSSRFQSPQGITWISSNAICVADTENHAIREINLKTESVRTLYKTNSRQMNELRSPWDLVCFNSIQKDVIKKILLIAAAGSHQIWAYFFGDAFMINKNYSAGTCISIAGSGKEENRNNSYPHKAGFAQPSGLALCELNDEQQLLVADSESSSIRVMSLVSGKVTGLVGGEFDPLNLFGFGDIDGKGINAKLQHPMGIVWNEKKGLVYIADTYNHKIKTIDVESKTCSTLYGTEDRKDNQPTNFDEPNGLAIHRNDSLLYITDTNNHKIKILDINNKQLKALEIRWKPRKFRMQPNHTVKCKEININSNNIVIVHICITVTDGVHINAEAPNSIETFLKSENQLIIKETQIKTDISAVMGNFELSRANQHLLETNTTTVEIAAEIYCCVNETCWKRSILFLLPIAMTNSKDEENRDIHIDYCIPNDSSKII